MEKKIDKVAETTKLRQALIYYREDYVTRRINNWRENDSDTLKIAEQAVDNGAEVNEKVTCSYGKNTPFLQIATNKNAWHLAWKILNKGADVNAKNDNGINCFHALFLCRYYFESCDNNGEADKMLVEMLKRGADTKTVEKIVENSPENRERLILLKNKSRN